VSSSVRTATRSVSDPHAGVTPKKHSASEAGERGRAAWSKARLSAAVAAIRCGRVPGPAEQPMRDEIEFLGAVGTQREVRAGATLARRGTAVDEVHLVQRGALAVIGDHGGRRPIVAFTLRRELCCAVPALLEEATPWDAVAVMDSSVITVPAHAFTAAVQDRWVDRWTTRTLTWLAEVGTWVTDLDQPDPTAQVAALLLRVRATHPEDLCRRTITDLLDLDDVTTRRVLSDLERRGALRHSGGCISVARPDMLRATLVPIGRPQGRATARTKVGRRHAPRAVAAG
jgi:CRP-like cAMP-binding protein